MVIHLDAGSRMDRVVRQESFSRSEREEIPMDRHPKYSKQTVERLLAE